jgi:hypothetical protein
MRRKNPSGGERRGLDPRLDPREAKNRSIRWTSAEDGSASNPIPTDLFR